MGITRFPHGVSSFGIPLIGSGPVLTTGNVFFVDSGIGSNGNNGLSPEQPFATIDYAIGRCTADNGDVIIVAAGHAETVSTVITCDIADVTIIGVGNGKNRPALTGAIVGDAITVTADDVTIANLYFPASSAAVTARINVAAANCVIKDCLFLCGANDLESITLTASAVNCTIEGNRFQVTAQGPDAAIEVEATGATGLIVRNNIFEGGDDTNAWDVGAVNSGVAHTGCLVQGNVSNFGPAIIFSAAATGIIIGNYMGEGTLGSMLDPGSCMCAENYEADAINETGRLFPTGVAT